MRDKSGMEYGNRFSRFVNLVQAKRIQSIANTGALPHTRIAGKILLELRNLRFPCVPARIHDTRAGRFKLRL
jgi:hypothetical protein